MDAKNAVILKSYPNGIQLFLDSGMEFSELLEQVAVKFRESAAFFRDAAVAVSFEGRTLSKQEELRMVQTITDNSQLNITCIVGKDEELDRFYSKAVNAFGRMQENASAQFYRGTLRRGQMLETESGIIILGDVEAGASVISTGSIVVLGALRGNAYISGKEHYIAALEMTPQKLKIGDFKYQTEDKQRGPLYGLLYRRRSLPAKIQPQMAYVEKGRIVLRPITNEYPGGLMR